MVDTETGRLISWRKLTRMSTRVPYLQAPGTARSTVRRCHTIGDPIIQSALCPPGRLELFMHFPTYRSEPCPTAEPERKAGVTIMPILGWPEIMQLEGQPHPQCC